MDEVVNYEAVPTIALSIQRKSEINYRPKCKKNKFKIPIGQSICYEFISKPYEEYPTTSRLGSDRYFGHYSIDVEFDDNAGFLHLQY